MKATYVLALLAAVFATAAIVAGAVASFAGNAPAPLRDVRAIHEGIVRNVYWVKGSEIEGYTSADEGHLKSDRPVTVFTGIDASATVFPNWVIVKSRSGTKVIPRENLVLLELKEIPVVKPDEGPEQ